MAKMKAKQIQGLTASSLTPLNEGNGIGHVIAGRNPAFYGNVGLDSIDLSYSDSESTEYGATGPLAVVVGSYNIGAGYNCYVQGEGNTVSNTSYNSHTEGGGNYNQGSYSHVEGVGHNVISNNSHTEGANNSNNANNSHIEGVSNTNTPLSNSSHTEGANNYNDGTYSHVEGQGNYSRSQSEHSGGMWGTDYTAADDDTDRLVNYGNGSDSSNRSDAFTVFKNGAVRIFRATLASITNPLSGMIIFNSESSNRPTVYNGSAWKGLAYTDDTVPTANLQQVTDIGATTNKAVSTRGLNSAALNDEGTGVTGSSPSGVGVLGVTTEYGVAGRFESTNGAPGNNILEVIRGGMKFSVGWEGAARFFVTALSSITLPFSGMLIFNSGDNNRPHIHNGSSWKGLAYTDELAGTPNVFIQQTEPGSATPFIWFETNALGEVIDIKQSI
jgi:hypothetical protein